MVAPAGIDPVHEAANAAERIAMPLMAVRSNRATLPWEPAFRLALPRA